jgi:hypothetical protein
VETKITVSIKKEKAKVINFCESFDKKISHLNRNKNFQSSIKQGFEKPLNG